MGALSLGGEPVKPLTLREALSKEDYEKLIAHLLESEDIKDIYRNYIRKDIPFEKWVRNSTDRLVVAPK
jgi:hypothetical protein